MDRHTRPKTSASASSNTTASRRTGSNGNGNGVPKTNFYGQESRNPIEVPPKSRSRIDKDHSVSPGSKVPVSPPSPPNTSTTKALLGDHRRELSVLQDRYTRNPSTSSGTNGSGHHYSSSTGSNGFSSILRSNIFDVTDQDQFQLTPNFQPRPSTSTTGTFTSMSVEPTDSYFSTHDDRRPSAASVATTATASSNTSKSSGRPFLSRMWVFGGADGNPGGSAGSSDLSLPPSQGAGSESIRSYSHSNSGGRSTTPTIQRPRTPLPHPDVVPFAFQDPADIRKMGYAPIHPTPVVDKNRYYEEVPPQSSSSSFFRKDKGREYEGKHKDLPARPPPTPKESSMSINTLNSTAPSTTIAPSGSYFGRPSSPSPSFTSSLSAPRSPIQQPVSKSKKKFPFHRKDKKEKEKEKSGWSASFGLRSGRGTPSELQLSKSTSIERPYPQRQNQGSAGSIDLHAAGLLNPLNATKGLPPTPGRTKLLSGRKNRDEYPFGRDGADERARSEQYLTIDADFTNLVAAGIIKEPQQTETSPWAPSATNTGWIAPPSWEIQDKNEAKEDMEDLDIYEKPSTTNYCIRIFRTDSTFATLSANLHSSVNDIIHMLGRKSFVSNNLGNYQIVMKKQGLLKLLNSQDRPLVLQKRLLEQAGYTDKDHLEEVGREDHSYLCRFTFQPSRMDKYTLEADPDLTMIRKFSHIDLEGKNLLTIPIALYRKSSDIISLNLSRNLSLNIPLDFIQACINLRKIDFQGNEVYKLPSSLSHASRLTYLDISNNRLEELHHAQLEKHPGMVSLKMSNNRLSSLPDSFAAFKNLRTLNIASNFLVALPPFLCDLVTLVDLDISFNLIQNLPAEIGKLTKLERFMATNNLLSGSFPASFAQLTNLKELDIRYNQLENIDVLAELPRVELLLAGDNKVLGFEKSFPKLRILHLNNNPLIRFALSAPCPTLTLLNLASCTMSSFEDTLCEKLPNLEKLQLDKNKIMSLPASIGKLKRLEHLSCYRNILTRIPSEIGQLQELKYLDLHGNHLKKLPTEIWHLSSLITLNLSSNDIRKFPKFASNPATPAESVQVISQYPSQSELGGRLEGLNGQRRPSGPGANLLGIGSSPGSTGRQGSMVSVYGPGGRKASVISKPSSEYDDGRSGSATPIAPRKDSTVPNNRVLNTIGASLRHLYLGDNDLDDQVFEEIAMLAELRVLNLSYNGIYDILPNTLNKLHQLNELYLSGNELTSLPADDLEHMTNLLVLHLNGNKFQTLPAELGKIRKLAVLDVGGNALKYNISNWPFDWNWNWNLELKYLNLSGNKRLEIKPSVNSHLFVKDRNITDFSQLSKLRVLGLMDVTLTIPSVPDETEDRRVRTSGSVVRGAMPYGMADSLGKNEHLSVIDLVIPEFRNSKDECLIGMFDGQALSNSGCRVSKHLQENFSNFLEAELNRMRDSDTIATAIRRAFLNLNKNLANTAMQTIDEKKTSGSSGRHGSTASNHAVLGEDDLHLGATAAVVYIASERMYVANVGDVEAVLVNADGTSMVLTKKHEPDNEHELRRIRNTGAYVSRSGKLNDTLTFSRSFGYFNFMPAVMAAPHIHEVPLSEQFEYLVLASKEVWEYVEHEHVATILQGYTGDLMKAASRVRDFAISFGATDKCMVMVVGVGAYNKSKIRDTIMPKPGEEGLPMIVPPIKRPAKGRSDEVSHDGRRPGEVAAPEGELAMVFTDIKNSTALWERFPGAMQAAIATHNQTMRRELNWAGGYEVKTEGDAFMVCFPTPTAALLWCFHAQIKLLSAPWPTQILESEHGKEILDAEGEVIYRGLSVRMGIHWGNPLCEIDITTGRMDYYGPMVNRAARVSGEADGGQITISRDFLTEIRRYVDAFQSDTLTELVGDEKLANNIRKEMVTLSNLGFEVKDLGMRKLKGLENMENVFSIYPPVLAGREKLKNAAEAEAKKSVSEHVDPDQIWKLWELSLRLESICMLLNTAHDNPVATSVNPANTDMIAKKELTDTMNESQMIAFLEHVVTRIENSMANLAIRRMLNPGGDLLSTAAPLTDLLSVLESKLGMLY